MKKAKDQITLPEQGIHTGSKITVRAADNKLCAGSVTLNPGESATFEWTKDGRWKVDALTWFRQLFR